MRTMRSMEEAQPSGEAGSRVTAAAVAANLRVLSVRLDDDTAKQTFELSARVKQIVELFIEKHWRAPRRFAVIRALNFVLLPGQDDATFAEDIDALTLQLERHLFGEGVEIKCVIGDASAIEALAAEPQESFITAHAASVEPAQRAKDQGEDPATEMRRQLAAVAGQLRLFAGYDAPKSAVLCYVVSLGRGEYPAAPAQYDDVARLAAVRPEAFEFASLRYAADKIADKARTGAVGYCLVPLSYETLADRKRREAFLKVAGALPEEVRRFILPSIHSGPPGPATNFLVEIVGALRTCFVNVDWQTTSSAIELDPLKHAGVFAVTLVLPRAAQERRIELVRLPSFVRRLGALRLRSGVAGLASPSEIEAAIESRAQYLSGPAVSVEMPDLTPRIQLSVQRLPLAA